MSSRGIIISLEDEESSQEIIKAQIGEDFPMICVQSLEEFENLLARTSRCVVAIMDAQVPRHSFRETGVKTELELCHGDALGALRRKNNGKHILTPGYIQAIFNSVHDHLDFEGAHYYSKQPYDISDLVKHVQLLSHSHPSHRKILDDYIKHYRKSDTSREILDKQIEIYLKSHRKDKKQVIKDMKDYIGQDDGEYYESTSGIEVIYPE